MYHHRNIIFPFKPQTNLRSHTNTHADMYVLRLLLAATCLYTTKHPFDTLVHLNNDEIPFAMDLQIIYYLFDKSKKIWRLIEKLVLMNQIVNRFVIYTIFNLMITCDRNEIFIHNDKDLSQNLILLKVR